MPSAMATILSVVMLSATLLAAGCETVPITGRSQLMLMPEGDEVKLGFDSYQEILKKSKLSTDPRLNEQVTRVGRRIAEATGRHDFQWEFKVIEDAQANAFCLPGGKVAVYTGILPITRDDAGLAAVLGHEVAHAVARHGGERLSQQMAADGVSAAAAQTLMAGSDPQMVQLVASLFGAGLTVGALRPWSRTQESEADHLGLIYMAKAGYHPSAARELWVRMGQASGGAQQSFLEKWLATHPSASDRVTQIEGWIPEALQYYKAR